MGQALAAACVDVACEEGDQRGFQALHQEAAKLLRLKKVYLGQTEALLPK